LTGFSHLAHSSLAGKWLNLLTDLVPGIDCVMVLRDPAMLQISFFWLSAASVPTDPIPADISRNVGLGA